MIEETDLFARRSEPRAMAEIAERYDHLATRLARRFAGRGESIDDLTQVARLGLVNAINRFEVERGFAFATFATRTIVGELKRHLRDKAWSVRVPRSLQERTLEVGKSVQHLTQRLGRSPTLREIAADIDCDVEEVIEALEAGGAFTAASMDAPIGDDADSGTLGGVLGGDDEELERSADRVTAAALMEKLPPREHAILYQRFFEGKTQSEIAESMGISQMHVSRLLRASLDVMRRQLGEV